MTQVMWIDLVLFMATILAAALYGLTASGHFPASGRSPVLSSPAGIALLWLTIFSAVAAAGVAARFAWMRLPWPATVIGSGLALLFAPLVLQSLPDRFVDGRRALIVFAGAACALAAIGWRRMI